MTEIGMDSVDDLLLERCRAAGIGRKTVQSVRDLAQTRPVLLLGVPVFAALFPDDAKPLLAIDNVVTDAKGFPGSRDLRRLAQRKDLAAVFVSHFVNGIDESGPAVALRNSGLDPAEVHHPVQEMVSEICRVETKPILDRITATLTHKKLSLIVLSGLDNLASLKTMLDSLARFTRPRQDLEVTVVLNGTPPEGAALASERLAEKFDVNVVYTARNAGVAHGFNRGIAASRGEYVCLLQDDIVFSRPRWDEELASYLDRHPRIGIVGGYHASYMFAAGARRYALDRVHTHVCSALQGACDWPLMTSHLVEVDVTLCMCMMLRREVGLLDPEFSPNGLEDIALCFQARDKGYRIYATDVGIQHDLDGATRPSRKQLKRRGQSEAAKRLSRAYHYEYILERYRHFYRPAEDLARLRIRSVDDMATRVDRLPKDFA